MSEALREWANAKREKEERAEPRPSPTPPGEKKALEILRREARRAGSLLASDGEGGLPPSLVLGVMRRDKFRCKVCGKKGSQDNGGISIHHKYQHMQASQEKEKGERAVQEDRRDDPSQMICVCDACHDAVHEKDRTEHGEE